MFNESLYTTRRALLSGSLGLISAASTLPLFLGSTLRAFAQRGEPAGRKGDADPILVVIQLAGGNDGLNTIIPGEMDPYYKLRRNLAIRRDEALRLEQGLGLHPAATGLKALFDDGLMAVVQGVGYPNPNRSHFTSTDIWATADPQLRAHSGWLGRYFDSCCQGAEPPPEPIEGVALTQETPLALQGETFAPLAFENADALRWRAGRRDRRAEATFRQLNNVGDEAIESPDDDAAEPGADSAEPGADAAEASAAGQRPARRPAGARGASEDSEPALAAFLQRAALKAQLGADEIRAAAGELGGRRRGGRFAATLQMIARMIAADLPTRVYYASLGGFDTHTGQAARHRRLMQELGDGVKDFVDTLKRHKLLERVLVMTFSEFGRRVEENASGGTDHGEAAPMLLFGPRVRAGLHGRHPDLTDLRRGDLKYHTDFRRVYAGVLRDWLRVRPETVLGRGFSPLRLIDR